MWETKKGLRILDSIAKRFRPILKYWSYLGILIGFLGMAFILYTLTKSVYTLLIGVSAAPAVSLVIPGVKMANGIRVPLIEGILALITLLFIHEGGHGVIARVHNIKIKSAGAGLLAILPFAFVRPDEKQLAKAPLMHRLSMYAAGPWANITSAIIAVLAMIFLVMPAMVGAFETTGLEIMSTEEGLPMQEAGVIAGDTLLAIDGIIITDFQEFIKHISTKNPGDVTTFTLQDREVEVIATNNANTEAGYFGFSFYPQAEGTKWYSTSLLFFSRFLKWFTILSLGIGLFNLLPIPILDGGKMMKDGIFAIIKDKIRANKVFMYLSLFSTGVLIGAIVLPFMI
jgi:membrane-associated protease RseP (regulator of RpoE activity)